MREWPLGLRRCWLYPFQGAVDRRSADAEELGEFSLCVRAQVRQLGEMLGLVRLLATKPTPLSRYLHSFTGAHADQVGFELRHHRERVEQQPSDGVGRIVD